MNDYRPLLRRIRTVVVGGENEHELSAAGLERTGQETA